MSPPIIILIIRGFNALVALTALALLIESAAFTYRPGPSTYYSPFATIVIATCLCFQCFQTERVARCRTAAVPKRRLQSTGRYIYFTSLAIASFVAAVGFALTPKPDTTALALLTTFQALASIWLLSVRRRANAIAADDAQPVAMNRDLSALRRQSTFRTCCRSFVLWFNRVLMFVHVCIVILTASGGVQLALTYQYANPGTIARLQLPTGESRAMNYYCTSVGSSQDSQPTIWFEGSAAHGVVDFLGVQTILRDLHGRNSCSYDPPNFGWSDRLPRAKANYFDYFTPLLEASDRTREQMVLVGWGDGGTYALTHAIEHPNTTTALVLLDVSPDGIEFLDAQRANNWTESETLAYAKEEIEARSSLAEAILGIGVTWGLLSVVIPNNSTGYFDPAVFPRYAAQGRKEDLWAYQYYALRQQTAEPLSPYLLKTSAPEGVKVRTIMTYDAGTDAASDEFYRQEKLRMVNSIADKNITDTVAWCKASNCSLGFPVDIPWWTADQLIRLGI